VENVTKALSGAAIVYGIPWDSDQLRGYLAILSQSGASDDRLAAGVVEACKVCDFMPKPSEILRHMPSYSTQTALPASDDFEMSQDDRDFGKAAATLFAKYVRKEITKDQMVQQMRSAARDLGIEARIDWENFYEEGAN
jgi:hypothetical protein